MGNESKPPQKPEDEWEEPVYLIKLSEEESLSHTQARDKPHMSKSQRRKLLHRPSPFQSHSTRETYKSCPQLACCQPGYPKLPFPQPWGVPISPTQKMGHPSCPPAANLDKLNVMNQARAILTKYYDNYLCPGDLSDEM